MGLFSSKKSKTPATRTPIESPNTLQSKATGRVLYAIGEGLTVGIVGDYAEGGKNLYLNGTPLINADGSSNFKGVKWDYRRGDPDQSWIPGFPAVEAIHAGDIGLPVEVTTHTPATRSIVNTNANRARITIVVNSLFDQNATNGDMTGTRIDFLIRVRRQGRSGWEFDYPYAIEGKTTSTYEAAWSVDLPGDGPWDIQVVRMTPDSNRAGLQNSFSWSSITDIIDRKLSYPRTALLALEFDAELFGGSMPTVTAKWRGWFCRVPTNYSPEGRDYVGIWDGTYKIAYTDNPAWLFLQLLTHAAGANLPDSMVDRWSLYSAARYCDELVPSGLKNADGSDILEPRFTAHFNINTAQEAYAALNALASTFRAMAYWANGAVQVVQDAPRDPHVIVSPANTTGGLEFSGPAARAIHSVAIVSFINDEGDQDVEVYQDADLIERYGWQASEITAFACRSRGQSKRLGKWLIETEKLGDTLSYRTSLDHIEAAPGDIVAVADKHTAGVRMGGRVINADSTTVTLDDSILIEGGKTYTLHVTLPNGTVEKRTVTNTPGRVSRVTVLPPFPSVPVPESMWAVEASDLALRQFRIIGVNDEGDLEYSVAAVPHDPAIYARVERGINVATRPWSKMPDPGVVQPPLNPRVERQYISTPTGWTDALQISWDASPDAFIRGYVVRYRRNSGNFTEFNEVTGLTQTIYGDSAGQFLIHIHAVNFAGVFSRPAILEANVLDTSPITLLTPTGLEIEGQGNNHEFLGRDPVFVWRGTAVRGAYPMGTEPAAGAGYLDPIFRDYEVRVYTLNGTMVFVDHVTEPRYIFSFERNSQSPGGPYRAFKFEVLMRDKWGNYSKPAAIDVANPAPAQVTGLMAEGGYGSIFLSFDKPADLDYEGCIVWMGNTSGFATLPEAVVYDGPNNFIFLQAPIQVTRYLRVAGYDSFGKTGLNVSAELKVVTVGVEDADTVPPAVPTGLALTDEVRMGPDGTKTFWLIATWAANADDDFRSYGVEIAEETGNFLFFSTNVPRYEWMVQAGTLYRVRLSASDYNFNDSISSPEVSIVIGGDDEAPSVPTSLTPSSAFKTIWVQWPAHPDPDFSHMEIWEATVNDRTQATYIANAPGTTFTRENLPGGAQFYYWIRAVDRSRNKSSFFPASLTGGIGARTKKIEEADYQELSIVNAAIANGTIDDAKIASLNANKIIAGSVLSGEVIVSGTGQTLGATVLASGDPASAINRGTTTILPGKITLSSGTTLANILYGPDQTKIHGGSIAARTITADKLTVGVGVEFVNVAFTPVRETSQVTWTAGTAIMPATDSNGVTTYAITSGSLQWTTGVLFIYWTVGTGNISGTTDQAINANPSVIVLGTYTGAERLFVSYARTIIDGNGIRARTINADRIQAQSITATELSTQRLITATAQIDSGLINSAHIGLAQINTGHVEELNVDRLRGGIVNAQYIRIGDQTPGLGFIDIESRSNHRALRFVDSAGVTRVSIGQNGPTPNRVLDGLYVRDLVGKDILTANGLGVAVAGMENLVAGATYNMSFQNTDIMGWSSVGGGTIHVTTHLLLVGPAVVRMLLNGVAAQMEGINDSATLSHIFQVAPGTTLRWDVQSNAGNAGWVRFTDPFWMGAAKPRCQIVAVEYKR
jgi:predicted phage tail protein